MSRDMGIPAAVAEFLIQRELPARVGWSNDTRPLLTAPVVVVTVREYQTVPGGFAHYLGERYDETRAVWEECYGRKAAVTLGLDVMAPETVSGEELEALAEKLLLELSMTAPEGLQVETITCGSILRDEKQRCLRKAVTAECTAWLLALRSEETEFLDFELRGGWKH